MNTFGEVIQRADWQKEKHIPVIECPDKVKAGDYFPVKVTLGKAVAHPNTTEHHIRWISLYFHPEGEKAPYQVGLFQFAAHGESVKGPNEGPVYTHHEAGASLKINTPGRLYALAYCNIHGVWESARDVALG